MKTLPLLLLLVMSCSDSTVSRPGSKDAQITRTLIPDTSVQDIQVVEIPDITVDAWVDPCADLVNTDDLFFPHFLFQ